MIRKLVPTFLLLVRITRHKHKAGFATDVVHKSTPTKGKGARKRQRQPKPSRVKEIANKTLTHQESLRLRSVSPHADTAVFTPNKTKSKRKQKQKTPTVTPATRNTE